MIVMEITNSAHLRQTDLNLLKALDALLAERSVTRAAERLGLTQSALSHILVRLRAAFADPLFVRVPGGIEPTPRAEAMTRPLAAALAELARVIAPPEAFDPARSRRHFVIATDDYLELILLPKLLARLWRDAPGISMAITPVGDRPDADLVGGKLDALISVSGALGTLPGTYLQKLFDERFVCVLRKDHPAADAPLTIDQFAALPHALVAPRGRAGSIVDKALARLGKRRRVALEIPHFLAAPAIVRQTGVILTIGERLARMMSDGLALMQPTLGLPGFAVALFWRERHHSEPAHRWFRAITAEVAHAL